MFPFTMPVTVQNMVNLPCASTIVQSANVEHRTMRPSSSVGAQSYSHLGTFMLGNEAIEVHEWSWTRLMILFGVVY